MRGRKKLRKRRIGGVTASATRARGGRSDRVTLSGRGEGGGRCDERDEALDRDVLELSRPTGRGTSESRCRPGRDRRATGAESAGRALPRRFGTSFSGPYRLQHVVAEVLDLGRDGDPGQNVTAHYGSTAVLGVARPGAGRWRRGSRQSLGTDDAVDRDLERDGGRRRRERSGEQADHKDGRDV